MTSSSELRAFPPVEDAIEFIKGIDWENVRYRTLRALTLLGIVIAFVGTMLTSFGEWLQECVPTYDTSGMPEEEPSSTEMEDKIERIVKRIAETSSSKAANAVAADFEPDAHFTDTADIKQQLAGLTAYKKPEGF